MSIVRIILSDAYQRRLGEIGESGGPLLSLVEPQRFIITRVYLTHYCKAKTDFALLANKRWLGGESIKSLAKFFGLKEQTIKGYLWKLKNEPRFKTFYQQVIKE